MSDCASSSSHLPSALPSRTAPPIRLRVGPDRVATTAIAVLAALAGGGCVLWLGLWASQPGEHDRQLSILPWLAVPVGLMCAVFAWRRAWRRAARGTLAWDGLQWTLEPDPAASASAVVGDLRVAIDVDGWMLLRLQAADVPGRRSGPVRWLALSRAGHRAVWHAWRCAVYCPRPRPAPAAEEGHAPR